MLRHTKPTESLHLCVFVVGMNCFYVSFQVVYEQLCVNVTPCRNTIEIPRDFAKNRQPFEQHFDQFSNYLEFVIDNLTIS